MAPDMTVDQRRHDLDALRAGAMLLGIVYHALLSFSQGHFWPVVDSERHLFPHLAAAAMHGFRMPLFFVLSGFFVAMLWHRKGPEYLIRSRFRRVFVPLLLAVSTIVPVTLAATSQVPPSQLLARPGASHDLGDKQAVWYAVRWGDSAGVEKYLDRGGDPYLIEPELGMSLMSLAAFAGQAHIIEALIGRGVDVNYRDARGNTPMHAAALFGRHEIARLLIGHGVDTQARNRSGQTPEDMALDSWSAARSVAKWMNMELDEDRTKTGPSAVINELLQTGSITYGQEEDWIQNVVTTLKTEPILGHLWFLWHLSLLTLGFVVVAYIGRCFRLEIEKPRVALYLVCLVPFALVPVWSMHLFGGDFSFTLVPDFRVLFYNGIFFSSGALYFLLDDRSGRLLRLWWVMLPVALLIVFPPAFEFHTGVFGIADELVDGNLHRPASVVLQVLYVWLMILGCMGMARAFLRVENRLVRYLSDSAYWMYLTHLPLVIVMQSLVAEWDLAIPVKWGLIVAVVIGFLLLTYEYAVRYTWLGSLLNGPRKRF